MHVRYEIRPALVYRSHAARIRVMMSDLPFPSTRHLVPSLNPRAYLTMVIDTALCSESSPQELMNFVLSHGAIGLDLAGGHAGGF